MKKQRKTISVRSAIGIGMTVVVLAAVIAGILLIGSPAQERLRRLDERRISDLREISFAVDAYWTREDVLPASLEELGNDERIVRELADPVTGAPYEYHAGTGSATSYVLSSNTIQTPMGGMCAMTTCGLTVPANSAFSWRRRILIT